MCSCSSIEGIVSTYDPKFVEGHIDSSDFDYNRVSDSGDSIDSNLLKRRSKKHKSLFYKYSELCYLMFRQPRKIEISKKGVNKDTMKTSKIKELKNEIQAMNQLEDIRGSPSKWSLVKRRVTSVLCLFGRKSKKGNYKHNSLINDPNDGDTTLPQSITKTNSLDSPSELLSITQIPTESDLIELSQDGSQSKNNDIDQFKNFSSSESNSLETDESKQIQKATSHIMESYNQTQQYPSIGNVSSEQSIKKSEINLMFEKFLRSNFSKVYLSEVFPKSEKGYFIGQHMANELVIPASLCQVINKTECFRVDVEQDQRSPMGSKGRSSSSSSKSSKKSRRSSSRSHKKSECECSSLMSHKKSECECPPSKTSRSVFPADKPLVPLLGSPCLNPNHQSNYCPASNRSSCKYRKDGPCNEPPPPPSPPEFEDDKHKKKGGKKNKSHKRKSSSSDEEIAHTKTRKTEKYPKQYTLPKKKSGSNYSPPQSVYPTSSYTKTGHDYDPQSPSGDRKSQYTNSFEALGGPTRHNYKYAGEIVCIHNPPCLLINGCLHIPHTNVSSLCGSTTKNVQNIYSLAYFATKCERGCQREQSKLETQQCQTSIHRIDKMLQSACVHNPPCDMMPCCFRPNYNSTSYESCSLKRKCAKPTQCFQFESQFRVNKSIEHRTSTIEFDWKKKHLIQFTAKENVCTQVKPKVDRTENFCIHVPVCKKLPECCILAKNLNPLKQASMEPENCLHVVLSTIKSIDMIPTKEKSKPKDKKDHMKQESDECSCRLCECVSINDFGGEYKSADYGDERSQEEVKIILDYPKCSEALTSISNVLEDTFNTTGRCCEDRNQGSFDERANSIQIQSQNYESSVENNSIPQTEYVMLTARENVSIQANVGGDSKKAVCKHHPPCVKIPKCLGGKVNNNLMIFKDIPDCNHRPLCELIPACCRNRTNESATVGLQFPHTPFS